MVLLLWGALESAYLIIRDFRRKHFPFVPMSGHTRAFLNFSLETWSINESFNIAKVTDNGPGDFTIDFTTPINQTLFETKSLFGSKKPNDVELILKEAAKIQGVRIRYKKEPNRVELLFNG